MPNPHKVKIKNHKVTKNRHPITHYGETVTFVPEQPEIIEIWFDHGSPFAVAHLGPGDIGDSLSADVDKQPKKRTHYPYRTSPDPMQIHTGPEIIVDPGGFKGSGKGASRKSSRKGKTTKKKPQKRSVRKGKKKAGKKR
jgi:hypothetical protein